MPIIIENLTHTYMPGSVTQFTALYNINLTVEDGSAAQQARAEQKGPSPREARLSCLLARQRERTARYQIHQKESQCCHNEYAQQTHCNTLDDILCQVCQLLSSKYRSGELLAAP